MENKIELSHNFYFELRDSLNEISFLGQELVCGNLSHNKIENLFPKNNFSFFPIGQGGIDEILCIENLHKNNYFQPFDSILLDWPKEFNPHLSKINSAFPTPLCLTNKAIYDAGIFEKQNTFLKEQIDSNPIFFIESFNIRRLISYQLEPQQIHCLGGVQDCLQWTLLQEKSHPTYLLTNGFSTWFDAQFFNVNLSVNSNLCRKILHFLIQNKTLKILIAVDFSILKELNLILEKINSIEDLENYCLDKIIPLNKAKKENLFISEPALEAKLEYSKINGFISRELFNKKLNSTCVENWLEFLKMTYSKLFYSTAQKYTEWTKMDVSKTDERDFFRFAYRLAMEKNQLFPDSFDLLLSAKANINSNFSYELHKELSQFPDNSAAVNAFKKIELPLDSFYSKTHKMSLQKFATIQSQKQIKRTKLQSIHKNRPLKQFTAIPEEKYADNNWVNEDHPYSCSFPSEDIFMEKLAFDIKKNMREKVKAKEIITKELQSDFCEGLDLKETIRNLHHDKIMVKDTLNIGKSDIGAVVFGFAPPTEDERFPWQSFWLAEQHDDSHLMFYATPYKDDLIGPGIAKSEFGGFAVLPLDTYIEHPWNHPYILNYAQNSTECLILAGALSSSHKSVLFISHHPPSQHIIKILKQSGKNILYAKLDEFSKTDIRRVRTFHILAEAGVRNYAEKYIRKE